MGLLANQIDHSSEVLRRTYGNLHKNRLGFEGIGDLLEGFKKISSLTIHLVDKDQSGHLELVCQLPGLFGLHFYAIDGFNDDYGTIGSLKARSGV